ncbi:hypothetical protein BDK51DRAFT_51959 [Blyttiomyces helicus]|uniref:Uncharacterized protein n=1 Tax=Blyttiomyces helicus TaxID=388810 RepID=A0A4P9WM43_9FUNG|nr:hypothetical protein BDK51DRAFT_51959 [Blyttiomyces helicus]|eukprot:RKO92230.1 hypothetical protein BDK51DRAFT_51959 [Blyttiomyces helicus]
MPEVEKSASHNTTSPQGAALSPAPPVAHSAASAPDPLSCPTFTQLSTRLSTQWANVSVLSLAGGMGSGALDPWSWAVLLGRALTARLHGGVLTDRVLVEGRLDGLREKCTCPEHGQFYEIHLPLSPPAPPSILPLLPPSHSSAYRNNSLTSRLNSLNELCEIQYSVAQMMQRVDRLGKLDRGTRWKSMLALQALDLKHFPQLAPGPPPTPTSARATTSTRSFVRQLIKRAANAKKMSALPTTGVGPLSSAAVLDNLLSQEFGTKGKQDGEGRVEGRR